MQHHSLSGGLASAANALLAYEAGDKFTMWFADTTVEDLVCGKYGIRKPRLYEMGFPHNNCSGACPRAGQGQFARLLDLRPEVYAKAEQRNEWARKQIAAKTAARIANGTYKGKNRTGSNGGFIRVKRNNVTEYLHMKEFRERVQSGDLIPANYEMGGCGCFTDDE